MDTITERDKSTSFYRLAAPVSSIWTHVGRKRDSSGLPGAPTRLRNGASKLAPFSMETDAAPQNARGSNQRRAPQEHTVQLPEVPYEEVCPTQMF